MTTLQRFRVRLTYVERTYDRRRGRRPQQRDCTYLVIAATQDDAVAQALDEFHEIARLSSVGWPREIVAAWVLPVALVLLPGSHVLDQQVLS